MGINVKYAVKNSVFYYLGVECSINATYVSYLKCVVQLDLFSIPLISAGIASMALSMPGRHWTEPHVKPII